MGRNRSPDGGSGSRASLHPRLSGERRDTVFSDHGRLRPLPRTAPNRLMLFPTLDFLLFFIVVLALMTLLTHAPELRKLTLVAVSYFFYASGTGTSVCCSPAARC